MPHQLDYQGQLVTAQAGETVLDALLRVGTAVPFSCKGGACHTCLMQCTAGTVSERAQQRLPSHLAPLARLGYFLPCQCQVSSDMVLRAPQPHDLVTPCMLCEASGHDSGTVRLLFEPQAPLRYRKGQTLRVVTADGAEPEIVITSDPAIDMVMHGELRLRGGDPEQPLPAWAAPDAEFGLLFDVRGPLDDTPQQELPMPATDPDLWQALGNGALVRAVLEAFYPKVYANAQLAPFFRGVTMQRIIDKQYSFLWQAMTGEKIYFGDRPRNAHHWMVITHALFDLRQQLMHDTQRELGLDDALIARWDRFEEYFRPDMVKSTVWPRIERGVEVFNEGFDRLPLSEGSLCDHCGAEVASGVEVLYHRRTGTISCPACAPAAA